MGVHLEEEEDRAPALPAGVREASGKLACDGWGRICLAAVESGLGEPGHRKCLRFAEQGGGSRPCVSPAHPPYPFLPC